VKNILAFNGSIRKDGNTSYLLESFLNGVKEYTSNIEEIAVSDINLEYCRGCLRCNLLRRCSITDDDWSDISGKILSADVLVFASPVYFHHVPAPLKKLIDRFRSFIHVRITETGLKHTPWHEWNKDFVLIMCMGSSDASDARPAIELFEFMKSVLGNNNRIHIITATRLAVVRQVIKTEDELKILYPKIDLPADLAGEDYLKNQEVLKRCYELGKTLSMGNE
jgi:NAD(P)H-dependent FMN reductase